MAAEIYDVLREDHSKIRNLLTDLVSLDRDDETTHLDLIKQIEQELIPHTRAEESVFYNCLRTMDATKETAMSGFKEHLEAETILRTLQAKSKLDADWLDTARKLKIALEHHIEEEELTMFNTARAVITNDEAEILATAFIELKEKIKKEGWAKKTFQLMVNLLPPRFVDSVRKIGA